MVKDENLTIFFLYRKNHYDNFQSKKNKKSITKTVEYSSAKEGDSNEQLKR